MTLQNHAIQRSVGQDAKPPGFLVRRWVKRWFDRNGCQGQPRDQQARAARRSRRRQARPAGRSRPVCSKVSSSVATKWPNQTPTAIRWPSPSDIPPGYQPRGGQGADCRQPERYDRAMHCPCNRRGQHGLHAGMAPSRHTSAQTNKPQVMILCQTSATRSMNTPDARGR